MKVLQRTRKVAAQKFVVSVKFKLAVNEFKAL